MSALEMLALLMSSMLITISLVGIVVYALTRRSA